MSNPEPSELNMNDQPGQDPVAPLPSVPFDARADFEREVLAAISSAQREVWLADASFRSWPLNSLAAEQAIHSFLLASRANRVQLLVAEDRYLASEAARFMRLLRLFGNTLLVRCPPDAVAMRFAEDCSFVIVDRARMVRRFHRDSMRGVAEFHPNRVGPWVDQFLSVWDESTPGLSGTTLGLSG
jgi:hypothetical protein